MLTLRPSILFLLLYRPARILVPAIFFAAAWRPLPAAGILDPATVEFIQYAIAAWLAAALLWVLLAWLSRLYVLTDRRLVTVAGIIARDAIDVPLANLQHATVVQPPLQRLFGLGTIGVATAGSAGPAVRWLFVARPSEILAAIRKAAEHASPRPSPPPSPAAPSAAPASPAGPAPRIPVIGLAGGIGAGKSEVARILSDLGCVVIDSDLQARAALERPEVRDQLVQWWGRGILDSAGRVDRKAVARIVFTDSRERERLEELVHPLVRARRAELVDLARRAGAPAAVIDAPLLFEAGVDAECDAVIFVDAPRDIRLARVHARSGWDPGELDRREATQLPLEQKRERSDYVIANAGSADDLRPRVAPILEDVVRRFGAPPAA